MPMWALPLKPEALISPDVAMRDTNDEIYGWVSRVEGNRIVYNHSVKTAFFECPADTLLVDRWAHMHHVKASCTPSLFESFDRDPTAGYRLTTDTLANMPLDVKQKLCVLTGEAALMAASAVRIADNFKKLDALKHIPIDHLFVHVLEVT
jgi:hypothetical protein